MTMADETLTQGPANATGTGHDQGGPGLNRLSVSATLHCMTGCVIGEVLGLVVATA